jgi:hypothetical protein
MAMLEIRDRGSIWQGSGFVALTDAEKPGEV